MGQKIHPLGFRLGVTKKHNSQWFAKSDLYSFFLLEDHFLRENLLKRYPNGKIAHIEIQRKFNLQNKQTNELFDLIKIELHAPRPGILIGRNNQAIKEVRDSLEKELQQYRTKQNKLNSLSKTIKPTVKVALQVKSIPNPYSQAVLIAEFLVERLEKRVPFRRALKDALERAGFARLKGAKIQISGRLNGAEIARTEWIRTGRVPLQTLRADIDYCYKTAHTIYGVLGIKVWAFRGEQT
jgi:small subunit ribosomal protein S3